MTPIYIKEGSVSEADVKKIEATINRPVCVVYGEIEDCVLDNEETLRDKLAGRIMQGFCSRNDFTLDIDKEYLGKQRAEVCYLLADAMLKVRKNK